MAIWDPQHETMDRERVEALQLERLRTLLARVYDGSRSTAARSTRPGSRPATSPASTT